MANDTTMRELNNALAQKLEAFVERHVESLIPKGSLIWLQDGVYNTDGDIKHLMIKEDNRLSHAIAVDGSLCFFPSSKTIKGAMKLSLQSAIKLLEQPEQLQQLLDSLSTPPARKYTIETIEGGNLAWRSIANGQSELSTLLNRDKPIDIHLVMAQILDGPPLAILGFGSRGKTALNAVRAELNKAFEMDCAPARARTMGR